MEGIEMIEQLKERGVFKNYIDYIVFPHYKNLKEGCQINFNFPLTALVGKNGSGKSSVLKALYGVPDGYSCGDYWFTTEVDPIKEDLSEKNRFFYSYMKDGEKKEVLYQRMPREGNLDYWETSKPVKKIGMISEVRSSPIKKPLIYMDFRGEITAFDKAFYFGVPTERKIQDFLRNKSKYLKRVFEEELVRYPARKSYQTHDSLIKVDLEIIKKVNEILGKNYEKIKILRHRFYDKYGLSILVKTKYGLEYSEANAGSGESAVINLVYNIMKAENETLILLDEPEVSLHPSAQKRLKLFLLEQIKIKKHQVVISTHSPALIEGLPPSAIKIFINTNQDEIYIEENRSYDEAFFDLSDDVINKKTIICEDVSAKELIERILNRNKKSQYIDVCIGGGAEGILQRYVPVYSKSPTENLQIILDGDKAKDYFDLEDLSTKELKNIEKLKEISKELYGFDISIYVDGNKDGGNFEQKIEVYKEYINFHKNYVKYIPNRKVPEEIILSSESIKNKYATEIGNRTINKENSKDIIMKISEKRGENDSKKTISALITDIIDEDIEEIKEMKKMLSSILEMEME